MINQTQVCRINEFWINFFKYLNLLNLGELWYNNVPVIADTKIIPVKVMPITILYLEFILNTFKIKRIGYFSLISNSIKIF